MINDSSHLTPNRPSESHDEEDEDVSATDAANGEEPVPPPPPLDDNTSDLDLAALLNTIRSRYRIMCSSVGVRPRVQTATMSV
jgi:hypothetical protein